MKKKNRMTKVRRILAMAGVIVLVALYITTFVSAFFTGAATRDLFRISLLATIVIPLIIYIYILICRLIFGSQAFDEEQTQEPVKDEEEE